MLYQWDFVMEKLNKELIFYYQFARDSLGIVAWTCHLPLAIHQG